MSGLNKTLGELVKRPPLLVIVLGVCVLIVAALGSIPFVASTQLMADPYRWALCVVAAGLIVLGGVLLLKDPQPHQGSSREQAKLLGEYGFQFTSPEARQLLPPDRYKARGTVKKTPPETLRLFLEDGGGNWWPQDKVTVRGDNTWEGSFEISGVYDKQAALVLTVVGSSGQVLCDYYARVAATCESTPALVRLTPDIVECVRVEINRGLVEPQKA